MSLAFSSFVFLLGIGTPVAFAIGCTAVVTLVFTTDVPMALIAHQFFGGMDKFPIMAIPFFVLAGNGSSTSQALSSAGSRAAC